MTVAIPDSSCEVCGARRNFVAAVRLEHESYGEVWAAICLLCLCREAMELAALEEEMAPARARGVL